ncbi:MAG TPA: T9SS type A sorting domain-containing protein, partial [Flavobacteriaceae bacterium]|nr:T9SS type A sorting domain-containing protein [Flavobacteriaceae bacterium]
SSISIYPNPTKGIINIKGIDKPTKIELFSLDGKLLRKRVFNSDTFLENNLSKGIYFLKITSEEKSLTKKIVID